MRKFLLAGSALVCVALLANSAQAGSVTYIPVVPPAGSLSTTVFDINDSNVIAGSYNDSAGVEHGFFGPLDGSNYTVFDVAGATGTEPRAIGNGGIVTGLAKASGFTFGEEFFRATDGTITILQHPNRIFDGVAQGINQRGLFVGDFLDKKGVRAGYKGVDGAFKNRFTLPIDGLTSTNPRDKSNNGMFAGAYSDSSGFQHGFLRDGDTVTTLDYPQAGLQYTAAEGINDGGQVSGLWADSAGNRHGFVYDSKSGNYTLVDGGDGSTFQQVWGINNDGLAAVNTQQSGGYVSYIYCPRKASDCPSGGKEVQVHPIHAPAGTSPHFTKHLVSPAKQRGNAD